MKIVETLERYFQSFINQEKMHPFFYGLADYFEFIVENPETKKIYLNLIEARKNEYKKLLDLENRTIEELDTVRAKLLQITHENNLLSKDIVGNFELYDSYKHGRSVSSLTNPLEMDSILSGIAASLSKNGHEDLVKEFTVPHSFGHHLSDTLQSFLIQNNLRKTLEKTEVWGALFPLRVICGVIYQKTEKGVLFYRPRTTPFKTQEAVEWGAFSNAKEQWERLEKAKGLTVDEFVRFIRGVVSYKGLAQRVHNHFLKELEKRKETEPSGQNLAYENGVLYFQGQEIEISKNKNTDPHYLLETIFKDRYKTWNYDEISEDWDNETYDHKTDWKKYYQAGYNVNQKVAQTTTVKGSLEPTKTNVKINQKYL